MSELSQHYLAKMCFCQLTNIFQCTPYINIIKLIFLCHPFKVNVEGILAFLSVFVVLVKEAAGMLEGVMMSDSFIQIQ